MISRHPSAPLLASLALLACTPAAATPPAAPPTVRAQVCGDAREEPIDVLCAIGRPARELRLTCEATRLGACSPSPPAYAHYACRSEPSDAPPPSTRIYSVAWTAGALVDQPSLAAQPDAALAGVEHTESIEVERADSVFAAWDARLRALGCTPGVSNRGSFRTQQYFRCDDLEVAIAVTDSTATRRLATLKAGTTALFDCVSTGTHGRVLPR